jgi:hypothetical protein
MFRWEVNIQTDLKERGCDGAGLDWLPQNRIWWQALVNMITHLPIP